MIDFMDEPRLKGLLRSVRDNPGLVALKAAAELADEVRRLRGAIELSEAMCLQLESDLHALDQKSPERDLFGDAVRIDPQNIERMDS